VATTYHFTSARIGFRLWEEKDLENLHTLCSNVRVMEHFPSPLDKEQTEHFLHRLMKVYNETKTCYYAVESLSTSAFMGFIGVTYQDYEAPCCPAFDIGWRLLPDFWGKGYATEGAKRSMEYAFEHLDLEHIMAVCTSTNKPSERVMQKIGMQKKGSFKHPKLVNYPALETCIWYSITKAKHLRSQ